jgi:hypothetical protein
MQCNIDLITLSKQMHIRAGQPTALPLHYVVYDVSRCGGFGRERQGKETIQKAQAYLASLVQQPQQVRAVPAHILDDSMLAAHGPPLPVPRLACSAQIPAHVVPGLFLPYLCPNYLCVRCLITCSRGSLSCGCIPFPPLSIREIPFVYGMGFPAMCRHYRNMGLPGALR